MAGRERRSSLLVDELAVADAHPVAGVQRPRALDELLVEVCAVGRVQILEHHDASLGQEPGVARRGEGVLEPNVHRVAPSHHRALADVVDHARLVTRGMVDHQPPLRGAERIGAGRGVQARGVRWRRGATGRAAQVSQRAPGDPQREQVQHHQEPELQRDRDRLEGHYCTSNSISVVPSWIRSPDTSLCSVAAGVPLTRTPLVEPRSLTAQPSGPGTSWACRRETLESPSTTSQLRLRPTTPPWGGTRWRLPSTTSSARPGPPRRWAWASLSGARSRSDVL